ncbi:MAG: methionine--tRNA ligase [Candidatus Diapherotrites archaeon]
MVAKAKKFYITTAIDYPSGSPHLGHAYEKVCADAIARWHRLLGEDVFFLTGTDEHGLKIQRAAERAGMKPKEFVDMQVKAFQKLCAAWNISNSRFIRTTDADHEKTAQDLFSRVVKKGDIYRGEYEGLYCAECENFYLTRELEEGNCPVHKKKCEVVREESYFFKMGNYYPQLLELYKKNKTFVLPAGKKLEMENRLKEGLKDLSVSRSSLKWGVPLPNDKKHTMYVWFDALTNYVSGARVGAKAGAKGKNGGKAKNYWPADIHIIGKDILWFHSVIWPTMLFAGGIEPPKMVFVHGFINTESGEKMSKSGGTVIDPLALAEKYPVDALRYFLLRELPFGEDGNFSEAELAKRINNELANELGNLLNRTLVMLGKYRGGKVPKGSTDAGLQKELELAKIEAHMQALELHLALGEIFAFVKSCNAFINEKEPWKLAGKDENALDNVLYSLADSLRIISILLSAFMPEASEKINSQLGVKAGTLADCKFGLLKAGTKVKKGAVLFAKIA